MRTKVYIGQDNGVTSTTAILADGEAPVFVKTPVFSVQDYTKKKQNVTRLNARAYVELLKPYTNTEKYDCFLLLERPMINPTRFKASMSAIRAHEAMITIIEALGIAYQFIDSKEWQSSLLPKGCQKEELKKVSLEVGNRLFPELSSVKHPDRDGLLIAEYGRRSNF